jgi:hypothetical protein
MQRTPLPVRKTPFFALFFYAQMTSLPRQTRDKQSAKAEKKGTRFLQFVGRQYLLYRNGSRQLIRSKYAVADYQPGVSPKYEPPGSHGYKTPGTGFYPNGSCPGGYGCPVGATWALNPIPVRS